MANYQRGSRVQSVLDFRRAYNDQSESERFQNATLEICRQAGITSEELSNLVLNYVNSAPEPETNLRDLVEVREIINRTYHLNRNDGLLYRAIRGLPFYSNGILGYTFNRRRTGIDRGVFIFSI